MSSIWDSNSIGILMGTNNGLAGMVGDYNAIKSGSYGKLLKAYYSQNDSDSKTQSTASSRSNSVENIIAERKNPTKSKETKAADTATTSSSGDLKGSIDAIISDDTYATTTSSDGSTSYNVDGIRSAAEDFIKNYNSTISAAKGSSISGVTSNLSALMTKTANNSGSLSSIGITVGSDGKLSMDKTAFNSSDMSRVQDVLTKYGSSISQNASLLNFYSASGSTATSSYSATGAYSSSSLISNMFSGSI